jgi:predicted nucleotide-binding protein
MHSGVVYLLGPVLLAVHSMQRSELLQVVILEDNDRDAEWLTEHLERLLPTASIDRIGCESEFHTRFEQLKSNPPSLVIMDLLVRWCDPSTLGQSMPPDVLAEGHYRAGLRCAQMMSGANQTRDVPVIIYSAVSRSDLSGLPPNVLFLSKEAGEEGLARLIRSLLPSRAPSSVSDSVFIVHGHDGEAKEAVARFVEKLQLRSIILHEQSNLGHTIIEKFEKHSNVAFAIVLLTDDDIGASKRTPRSLKPRARQNVIFEFGFFSAKLGRRRVCALVKDGVEVPSDIHGVVYVPMDATGAWRTLLAREMRAAGLNINLNILAADS